MVKRRTPQACVDQLIAKGSARFREFVPPVKRYEGVDFSPPISWHHEYDKLDKHHRAETDALLAILEELLKRFEQR